MRSFFWPARVQLREVDHDRLLGAAGDHHHGLLVGVGVLLAVRHARRHEDVVAGARCGAGPPRAHRPRRRGRRTRVPADHVMAVSDSPWWWSAEAVPGATWVWPIHSFGADGPAADRREPAHPAALRGVAVERVGTHMVQPGARRASPGPPVSGRWRGKSVAGGGRLRPSWVATRRAARKDVKGLLASPAAMLPRRRGTWGYSSRCLSGIMSACTFPRRRTRHAGPAGARPGTGPSPDLPGIASSQQIPFRFLKSVVGELRKAAWCAARRLGGAVLARPAGRRVALLDVARAVDGELITLRGEPLTGLDYPGPPRGLPGCGGGRGGRRRAPRSGQTLTSLLAEGGQLTGPEPS